MKIEDAIRLLNRASLESQPLPVENIKEFVQSFSIQLPHSVPMEVAMTQVVEAFRTGGDEVRHSIVSELNRYTRAWFFQYAESRIAMAKQWKSADLIEQGVVALIIGTEESNSALTVRVLSALLQTAHQLGVDGDALLLKVHGLADSGMMRTVLTIARSKWNRPTAIHEP